MLYRLLKINDIESFYSHYSHNTIIALQKYKNIIQAQAFFYKLSTNDITLLTCHLIFKLARMEYVPFRQYLQAAGNVQDDKSEWNNRVVLTRVELFF